MVRAELKEGARVPRYYLGVDGGGTNCRIRLADAGLNTLAEAVGGRSNLQIEGGEPAWRSVSEGTAEVFRRAGLDAAKTAETYACFGMAGGRLPARIASCSANPVLPDRAPPSTST
jgi:glucosamine kinase